MLMIYIYRSLEVIRRQSLVFTQRKYSMTYARLKKLELLALRRQIT